SCGNATMPAGGARVTSPPGPASSLYGHKLPRGLEANETASTAGRAAWLPRVSGRAPRPKTMSLARWWTMGLGNRTRAGRRVDDTPRLFCPIPSSGLGTGWLCGSELAATGHAPGTSTRARSDCSLTPLPQLAPSASLTGPLPDGRGLRLPTQNRVVLSGPPVAAFAARVLPGSRDPFRLPTFATDLAARFCIHVPPVRAA